MSWESWKIVFQNRPWPIVSIVAVFFIVVVELLLSGDVQHKEPKKWRRSIRRGLVFALSVIIAVAAIFSLRQEALAENSVQRAVLEWQIALRGHVLFAPRELDALVSPSGGGVQPEVGAFRPLPKSLNDIAKLRLWDTPYKPRLYLAPRANLERLWNRLGPVLQLWKQHTGKGLKAGLHLRHFTDFLPPRGYPGYIRVVLPPYMPERYCNTETAPEIIWRCDANKKTEIVVTSRQTIPWFPIPEFSLVQDIKKGGFILLVQTDENFEWSFRYIKLVLAEVPYNLLHKNTHLSPSISGEGQRGTTTQYQVTGLVSGDPLPPMNLEPPKLRIPRPLDLDRGKPVNKRARSPLKQGK